MQTETILPTTILAMPSITTTSILKGVERRKEALSNVSLPPQLGPLAAQTIQRLQSDFLTKSHSPSPQMWDAISDIVTTVEHMADGTAQSAIYLSALDPGVGKTQSIIQFLPVLLASEDHTDVSVIMCVARLRQIDDVIRDARKAGLKDDDFAVFTSDKELNGLGRGVDQRHSARVLFTTHAMVTQHCDKAGSFTDAADFHFCRTPRQVRVWDEAIMPGRAVTVGKFDLASFSKHASFHNPRLADYLFDLAERLGKANDPDLLNVLDLDAVFGVDLNCLEGMADHPSEQQTANSLWLLSGKAVTVRRDGTSNSMLDYHETLPSGLAPLLVLDASSRGTVRETYNLWERYRGGIVRLREAAKDYEPLTIHHWRQGGGKRSFNNPTKKARIIRGIASAINAKPTEKWLVVHHKDGQFEGQVRSQLVAEATRVEFLNWGAHDATNDYADIPNVILAGTLFYRPSTYEGIGRAAAGQPSSSGAFDQEDYERVRRGEHRHNILQAICRGRVRKCEGHRCPGSDVYIIASTRSGIGPDLPNIFPGCRVVPWRPTEQRLGGKVGDAVKFIKDRTADGSFVSNAAVQAHISITDKSNFRNTIRKHADFVAALEELDIRECKQGRHSGFRRGYAILFGGVK